MVGGMPGRGCTWQRGVVHGRGACLAGDVHGRGGLCMAGGHAWQETVTIAGGTHPTGMHSCCFLENCMKIKEIGRRAV